MQCIRVVPMVEEAKFFAKPKTQYDYNTQALFVNVYGILYLVLAFKCEILKQLH